MLLSSFVVLEAFCLQVPVHEETLSSLTGLALGQSHLENAYDPAIPLLGIYPRNLKTLIQKYICTPIFIALLFTTAEIWKQPKCPSMMDKEDVYTHTMEYYSAIKKIKVGICENVDGP